MKAVILSSESDWFSKALKDLSFESDIASSKTHAIRLCRQNRYSLYIIDVSLQDGSGIEFTRILRTKTNAPVILVGSTHNEVEAVACFDAGADDYVCLPTGMLEFECHIKAVMRRCQNIPFTSIDWLDFDSRTATIDGSEVYLSRTEFDILSVLAASCGKAVSKRAIIIEVWGSSSYATDDALKVRINALRSKIGKERIETIRGYGYRLV